MTGKRDFSMDKSLRTPLSNAFEKDLAKSVASAGESLSKSKKDLENCSLLKLKDLEVTVSSSPLLDAIPQRVVEKVLKVPSSFPALRLKQEEDASIIVTAPSPEESGLKLVHFQVEEPTVAEILQFGAPC